MGNILGQFVPSLILVAIQVAAAMPWLWVMDPKTFRESLKKPSAWLYLIGGLVAGAFVGAFLFGAQRESSGIKFAGRSYGAILYVQISIDLFIVLFQLILLAWPKGGAVALSAFREGLRQPMFWLIALISITVLAVATIVPYFTFGDDYKMLKQICFDTTLLAAVLFGVLGASISINEEIEGRTAVTLMSKPVTRRQFLIGKFVGLLLASFALTLFIGWFVNWCLYFQPQINPYDDVKDTMPNQAMNLLQPLFRSFGSGEALSFISGFTEFTAEASTNGIGLVLGFGKVTVLLAISATLATRLPMAANLVLCMAVFFLGHLAPILRRVSEELHSSNKESTALSLVNFLTQLIETITPALEYFNMGPAIIRDTPLSLTAFTQYVGSVTLYSVVYTAIALLFGLILFEDRDLA